MLTPKKKLFADEYLIDLNATQAAIRAGYSKKTAHSAGERLLRDVDIRRLMTERMAERSKRTEITQDMVLTRWWDIANADANDLVQYRRSNCRNCRGVGFEYQWVDEQEYAEACAKTKEGMPVPSNAGGFGFEKNAAPVADCPVCGGEGRGHIYAADTRNLKGSALLLYDGVKLSKDGLEVKLRDRDRALENVARHLGMYKDKLDLTVTGALAERLARARQTTE